MKIYSRLFRSFQTEIARKLTNEAKSKCIVLAVGCSYVYVSGTMIHVRAKVDSTQDFSHLEAPVSQFFTSKFISHLSPYVLPFFVKGGAMKTIERNLENTDQLDLRRILSYSALMRITKSREAIDYLSRHVEASEGFSKHMEVFRVPIDDMIYPKNGASGSFASTNGNSSIENSTSTNENIRNYDLFFMKIKNFENALKNMEPKNRTLPYEYMRDLVKLSKEYSTTLKESISRVLYLLLENDQNVMSILDNESLESTSLISREDNSDVLSYLYSVKLPTTSLLSVYNENFPIVSINSECVNRIRKIAKDREIDLPRIKVPLVSKIWLKYRNEMATVVSATEVSVGYSFFRNVFSPAIPGSSKFFKIQKILSEGLTTTRGILAFNLMLAAQEKVIQSHKYFNDSRFMVSFNPVS